LKLAFDECGGTGKGYDTVYADLNFNGDLADDRALRGDLVQNGNLRECSFPPLDLDVLYSEKARGVERPWRITIRYMQNVSPQWPWRRFLLEASMRLKDESGEWEYSYPGTVELPTREKPEGVITVPFGGKPVLVLEVEPDGEKEGNVRVVARFKLGWPDAECKRAGKPLTARVEMKDAQRKIIHSEEVSRDRLDRQHRYSVRIPPGKHILEVTVDVGPLAGVVKGTKTLVMD
jgi:hypothetical protein